MDKFPNVDIGFPSQNIVDCIGVEPYNMYNEYIVNPYIGVSTIPDSINIDVQDQIMPTHKFHSLFLKMNNVLYLMMSCIEKNKIQMNQFIHSLLEV
jgi:hypothetical protein